MSDCSLPTQFQTAQDALRERAHDPPAAQRFLPSPDAQLDLLRALRRVIARSQGASPKPLLGLNHALNLLDIAPQGENSEPFTIPSTRNETPAAFYALAELAKAGWLEIAQPNSEATIRFRKPPEK